jgi:hypothetical protein
VVVVSLTERDGLGTAQGPETLTAALQAVGLAVECREADTADVAGSSWAKRLGIPNRRSAWRLEARKR